MGLLRLDLAAQQEMDVESEIVLFERRAIQIRDAADGVADSTGGRVHGFSLGQALTRGKIAAQKGHHGLGKRQVSTSQDDKGAFPWLNTSVKLGAKVYLVIAGIAQ